MMNKIVCAAGLAVGASAAILPRDQCCFQITAAGGKSGVVGQLGDGQNRIGGGYPTGTYCLNNGGITDAQGRGCILTPPTTQFQCDVGAAPTSGFSVSSSGQVLYNGSNKFYACGAAPDIYNIYTVPVEGQKDCVEITLSTGGKCIPSGGAPPAPPSSPAPSAPAPPSTPSYQGPPSPPASSSVPSYSHPAGSQPPVKSTVTLVSTIPVQTPPKQSTPAPSASKPVTPSGSACPTALTGPYQTPHLIVPVSSSQPDKAYGTQYNATISPSECTIFNFDIPQSYNSKSCSIIFLFPQQSQLQTSSFTFSGSGDLTFSELSGVANVQTTYNNAPSKKTDLGSVHPQPGNSYAISTESCAAGSTKSIEVCGANGLSLSFFQDYNPSPIGVFVTSC